MLNFLRLKKTEQPRTQPSKKTKPRKHLALGV